MIHLIPPTPKLLYTPYQKDHLPRHELLYLQIPTLRAVVNLEQVLSIQTNVRSVDVEGTIVEYILNVIEATRNSDQLSVGVSTRGALLWYRAAQAMAVMNGRDYVVPDDVKDLAVPVLSHRVLAKGMVQGAQREAVEAIVGRIVADQPLPT